MTGTRTQLLLIEDDPQIPRSSPNGISRRAPARPAMRSCASATSRSISPRTS
jgi:hypothetical protein